MAYEMVMPYHLHMPSYFLETFTEYPYIFKLASFKGKSKDVHNNAPYIIMTDKSHDIGNNRLL